ncbi:hypothetical protein A0J61_06828 [Choanephora cucurbitarum]|uniref:Wax synthase domain-containing protein n=1 Tax=Choanephora cucurbitarum TaxID=101091 RepID=A0A1C7N7T6_9FUNG|nr:hypothetical protein A0J61_06828 [Choanephora cucurbitarum]
MIVSLPVKSKHLLHELLLGSLWILDLSLPLYLSGTLPYACLMSLAVWSWASGMKMGVWLFSTSMQERQERPFYLTMLDWRTRRTPPPTQSKQISTEYIETHKPITWLWQLTKSMIIMDGIELVLRYAGQRQSILVFQALLSTLYSAVGQSEKAARIAPDTALTLWDLWMGTSVSILFCVYVQFHLQVAYDEAMLIFASLYHTLPFLEKTYRPKGPEEMKRALKRLSAIKLYLEETLCMPAAFDAPWSADSLRDFWGRRWHTYYNECFYRLGYRPIRAIMVCMFHTKPPRWLPALSVFIMSGLMHEYFLAATGSPEYLGGVLPVIGYQFVFFVMQAVAIVIGDMFFPHGPASRLYTMLCMVLTCHFFVVPYILTGYLEIGRPSVYRALFNIYRGNSNLLASVHL